MITGLLTTRNWFHIDSIKYLSQPNTKEANLLFLITTEEGNCTFQVPSVFGISDENNIIENRSYSLYITTTKTSSMYRTEKDTTSVQVDDWVISTYIFVHHILLLFSNTFSFSYFNNIIFFYYILKIDTSVL